MPVLVRRAWALALIAAMAVVPAACRDRSEGTAKVDVIGSEPALHDPALGPLSAADAVLLANVGQGLVRFDAAGNIVAGLAERWNVSDDGLSYIFRLATVDLPNRRKLTAQQVARVLKRSLAAASANPLKDTLGAVDDIVAMTDRVIEIRLNAPRPNLLALLAQPEFGIVRDGYGTGPFQLAPDRGPDDALHLTREIDSLDDDTNRREEILLKGTSTEQAVRTFAAGDTDLVLGGTFADLPFALAVKLPRAALRFDPASGLFGLVPTRRGGILDDAEAGAAVGIGPARGLDLERHGLARDGVQVDPLLAPLFLQQRVAGFERSSGHRRLRGSSVQILNSRFFFRFFFRSNGASP